QRLGDQLQGGRAVGGGADDLEIRLGLDQVLQAVEHDRMIVAQRYSRCRCHAVSLAMSAGIRTNTVVPTPMDDSISSSPPISASRSRMPGTPSPRRPLVVALPVKVWPAKVWPFRFGPLSTAVSKPRP